MKNKLRILLFLLVAAIGAGAWMYAHFKAEGEKHELKVSGNIEAKEVRLSFRIGGKIARLLIDEGDAVNARDLVATLETDELKRVKAEAKANLKAAKYAFERARDDALRMKNLYLGGSIPAQKRDASRTDRDSAKANLEARKAAYELARTRLSYAKLFSPLDGFALVKSAEEGEVVQAGVPVFDVTDLNDIWLTAYVSETQMGRVKLGQRAEVRTDTFPGRVYEGRVSYLSNEAEFTPKQIQTPEERVKLVYRIKVKVENTRHELKPGMPADGNLAEET